MVWLIVLVALGSLAGVVLLFAFWIRWLWRRASKRRRLVIVLPLLIGGLLELTGLIKGFGAVGGESVDPSQKARILAEGISEAMNCMVFGVLVAAVPLLVGLVVLTWMERRSKRARQTL